MGAGTQGLRHRAAGGVAPDRPGPGPLLLRGPGKGYNENCKSKVVVKSPVGEEAGS